MPVSHIDFSVLEDGVGVITIDRPEKRNAFTTPMRQRLVELLSSDEVQQQRAVIVESCGDAFSAGADLREVGRRDSWSDISAAGRIFSGFRRCGPVTIAAVQGYALGLGSGIAMACDLVVAADDAQFGYPEIAHGLVAGVTMVGLKEVVGPRKAMELLVTGRRVPAAEALDLGMLNEVVARERLHDRARELAREIAAHGELAVQTTKRFFYESSEMPFSAAVHAGERVIASMRRSDGARDGAHAFLTRTGSPA
jgi:enoyl-CoA hydratase/carnithine racemase